MKNALFIAGYLVFVAASNVLLKGSANAGSGWPFYALFAAGNAAGFVAILLYTGLLRTFALHLAFPLSRGFGMLGVLVSSLVFFHERMGFRDAAAVALVTAGILLVGREAQTGMARAVPAAGPADGPGVVRPGRPGPGSESA